MRWLLTILLIAAFASLGWGLFSLIRHGGESDTNVKSLTWRIGLSIVLFLFAILIARQNY